MHKRIEEAIDEIDAALFTGDTFEDPTDRSELMDVVRRWWKKLNEIEKGDEE